MIAKFNTGNGWSFHDCSRVLTYDERIDSYDLENPDRNHLIDDSGFVFGVEGKKPCKRIDIDTPKGWQTVFYGRDAYLMNDNGKTICSL